MKKSKFKSVMSRILSLMKNMIW